MKEKQQLLFRNSGSTGSDWLVAGTLDEFLQNGVYLIKMLNADGTLGLPFSVTNDDVVKLVVSDSGANGRQQSGRAVVQTITFARSGSARSITYTRTRRNVNGNQQWSSWVEPEAASTANIYDGSVTAEKLSDDIRPNAVSPLRPLFIAAGALYNDTGIDKTKTAPWGETVTHKAGRYYLNGLGDITEEQMIAIYNAGKVTSITPCALYKNAQIRTTLPAVLNGGEGEMLNMYYICGYSTRMEVFNTVTSSALYTLRIANSFNGCTGLKYILPILDVENVTATYNVSSAFNSCASLVLCKLRKLKISTSFAGSPLLSKESILYTIQNAMPASAITITLHPDAYARLADDAEIVAALEAQPRVSLVSA